MREITLVAPGRVASAVIAFGERRAALTPLADTMATTTAPVMKCNENAVAMSLIAARKWKRDSRCSSSSARSTLPSSKRRSASRSPSSRVRRSCRAERRRPSQAVRAMAPVCGTGRSQNGCNARDRCRDRRRGLWPNGRPRQSTYFFLIASSVPSCLTLSIQYLRVCPSTMVFSVKRRKLVPLITFVTSSSLSPDSNTLPTPVQ